MDGELLARYHIDYKRGLMNCMGDAAFYRVLLSMFLEDDSFPQAEQAYTSGDDKQLYSSLHELKGVSGNASLTALYETVLALMEQLRHGQTQKLPQLFDELRGAYRQTCEGIRLALQTG